MLQFPALKLINQGKVRDLYDLGEHLLIVTTDRISVFDVILPNLIPGKGQVLTELSLFWFKNLAHVIENHIVSSNIDEMPDSVKQYKSELAGRVMLVKKAKVLPVECIVRGYLTGSGLKEYQQTGKVCGIDLPKGLVEASKLPEIIFTPSTKAELGEHDENINFDQFTQILGKDLAEQVRAKSIEIYKAGLEIAAKRGIIIADTKFEFGIYNDKLILIDEVLTPDSSRFWPADSYEAGKVQDSYDKQYVREYYLSLAWNKKAPAPEVPENVIKGTQEKYLQLLKKFV